jgi:hypothetical protein
MDAALAQAPVSLLDDFQQSNSPLDVERMHVGSGRTADAQTVAPSTMGNWDSPGKDIADRFVLENTRKIIRYLSASLSLSDALAYFNIITSAAVSATSTPKSSPREQRIHWTRSCSVMAISLLRMIVSFHHEVNWSRYNDSQLDELARELQLYCIRLSSASLINLLEVDTAKVDSLREVPRYEWSCAPGKEWDCHVVPPMCPYIDDDRAHFLPFQKHISVDWSRSCQIDVLNSILAGSDESLPAPYRGGLVVELLLEALLGSRDASRSAICASLEGWSFNDVEPIFRYSTSTLSSNDAFSDSIMNENWIPFGNSPEQTIQLDPSKKLNLNFLSPLLSLMTWASMRTSVAAVLELHPELFSELDQSAVYLLANRVVIYAQRLAQTLLAILYGLWSRFPQFQRALLTESFPYLQLFIESVLETFINAAKAKYVEIICYSVPEETGETESAADRHEDLALLFERLNSLRSQVAADSVPPMSNVHLYKACGSTIGRMCLQIATSVIDSYFLACNRPSQRATFGVPSESFWQIIDKSMITCYKQPSATAPVLPISSSNASCIILLFNATVRRRCSIVVCNRLSSLLSHRISSLSDNDQDAQALAEVWSQAVLSAARLSKLILLSISLEQELSKRIQGAELNFNTRVLVPISALSDLIENMRKVDEAIKQYQGQTQSSEAIDKEMKSVPQTGSSSSSLGGSLFSSFGRRIGGGGGDLEASQAPKASTASSFGGLVGNLLKKGMQNISAVAIGPDRSRWTALFSSSNRDGEDSKPDFEAVVLPNVLNNIRLAFVHIIDVQSRRSSETVARILFCLQPLVLDTIVLDITTENQQNTRGQQIASILSGNLKESEDVGTICFLDYLYIYLYSLLIKDNPALAEQGAVLWGMLLSHPNPEVSAAARRLLVVEVKSPNDSSMSMKLDMWNYEGVGLSALVRIAALSSADEKGRESVPLLVQSISRWMNKMTDSLREAFKSQLIAVAKPFQRKTRIAIDSLIRPYLSFFEEPLNQKQLKLMSVVETKLSVQILTIEQRYNSFSSLRKRIVEDWEQSNVFGTYMLNSRITCPGAQHTNELICLRPLSGHLADNSIHIDRSMLVPSDLSNRSRFRPWIFFQKTLGVQVVNNRGVLVKADDGAPDEESDRDRSFCSVRAQIQPSVAVGIVQLPNVQTAKHLVSLKRLDCAGEWAIDPSEGYCRMRSRIRYVEC